MAISLGAGIFGEQLKDILGVIVKIQTAAAKKGENKENERHREQHCAICKYYRFWWYSGFLDWIYVKTDNENISSNRSIFAALFIIGISRNNEHTLGKAPDRL